MLVPIREVVRQAKALQDLMHDERESLPSEFWEVGDLELVRFCKTAWPTNVGQDQ